MTLEEIKLKLVQPNSGSDAYNKGIKKANLRANRLFMTVFNDFESRICNNCTYYNNEVCTNSDSQLCADFVDSGYGCNKF